VHTNYTSKDVERFWSKVDKSGGEDACWIWMGYTGIGYGQILWGKRQIVSHRIAWTLTYGDIPNDLLVLHKCDNPPCVNPKHLFLGTNQDNVDDKMRKGRYHAVYGEKHGKHKLTDLQVSEVRQRYSSGKENQYDLAKIYKVSQVQIGNIVRREQRIF